jgi:hypothetical protein
MKKLTCAAFLLAAAIGQAAPLPDNAELVAMNRADQADRTGDIDWAGLDQRDKERREKVGAMLAAGTVRTARDYYNAAMVFHHGDTQDDYALAFSLATIARRLAPEHPAPKWLFAAAFDRYLVSHNMPQWYGTQSKTDKDGRAELDPVHPQAVSEEQRVALGVPRLQDEQARIAAQNKKPQTN